MKKFKNVISIIVLLAIFAQNVTGNFEIIFADSETINEADDNISEEPALEAGEAANEKTADEILNNNKPEELEPTDEILNGDKSEEPEQSKESTETDIKNDLDKINSDNSEDIVSEPSSIENNKNSENSAEENTEESTVGNEEESTEVASETEQLLPFEEIEKFEIDLSDVPDEISALADRNYKKLNQSEQAALKAYYHVRKDTMDECAAKGFSVKDSIPLALIMQRLDIDLNEAINMSVSYQSEKKALKESFDFAELKDDNLELLNNEKVKEEIVDAIVDGCGSEEVVEAYPIAYAFNRDLKDFVDENINENANTSDSSKEISNENKISAANNISNENDTSSEKNKPENKAVNEKVKAISEKYQLDANFLDTALNEENITPEEAEEKINQAEEELGISLASLSADDNDSLPQKAPCDYVPGMFENVDILSGAVSYHDDIINLEGLNGLDLNLFYEYNSRRKMYMTVINGNDAIEMGGWTLNIPRMTSGCFYDIGKVPSLDKDDKSPGYIMLDDGREFKASMESIGTTGYLYLDDYAYEDISWAQEAKVVYDKDHAGGRNSKYTVLYRKGIKDYFDERGFLLFREDFLGNQITFDYNNNGSLIIKDTLNREIKVTFTDGSYSEIKQIILPDGKVISYTNSNPNIPSGNYRITKTESKNGKSLTTFFDMKKTSGCFEYHYEQIKGTEENNSNKDERFNYELIKELYSSSLLVKVTMPTNMYITYEYENDIYFNQKERQKDDDETLYDYKVAPYGLGCSERISKISYYKDNKNYYWEMYDTLDYSGSQSKRRFFRRVKTSRNPNAYTEMDFNPQGQKTAEYFVYTDSDNTKTIETKEYTYPNPSPRQVYRKKPYYFLYNERYALKTAGYEEIQADVPEKVTIQKGKAIANVDDNMRVEFKIDKTKPIYYHEDNYNYDTITKDLRSSKSYPEGTEYAVNSSYCPITPQKRFTKYGRPYAETFRISDNAQIVVKNYYDTNEKYLTSKETYEEKNGSLIFKSKTDYSYNTDGRLSKKVDYVSNNTKGLTTTYTYSGTTSPTLVKTELPNGEYIETKYTYDTMGNVTSMTDGEGRKTQYEYDWRGNLTKVTNPQGGAKSSVFDYAANKITLTDENGNTVTYDYDCFGNLEEVKAGNSLLKKCEYDYKNFCLIKETSPDSKTVTSYTYDSACRPVSKITLENGKEIYNETMSYGMENVSQYTKNLPNGKNATGNVVTSVVKGDGTNTQSITTKTVTDYNGNTISQECGGVKKSYEYDCLGNMIKESPYAGYSITYEYDPAGNVVSQTDSTGVTSKKEYDGLGRLVKEYTPKGIAGNYFTQYTYKGFTDMLKSVTIPLDNGQNMVKEYETDKTGNVLKETVVGGNAGNSVTEYTYNEIGLPVTVTAQGNKEANVTTYTYDKVGNKTSMTTGNALSKTIYKYDNLNRLTYLINVPNETKYTPDAAITIFPEHCIEKYEYDVNGNLSKKTDRNGNVITYAYDGLNRLKSQKTGDLEKTAEYALTGAKVKENYGNAELNYKYDARGNLIYEKSSLDGKSFINEYTYDGKNFLNSFKYKNDNTQVAENTYTYTAKGQLEKVYENGNQVAAYSYDLDGNLEKTTYVYNVVTAYDYNCVGFIKSVQSKKDSDVLDSYSYTYYNNANQKTKTYNGVIMTYNYDLYGRLTGETPGGIKKSYT